MRYQHCIFDLYGTLVDIHTDESRPELWTAMATCYREEGAAYGPDELQESYLSLVKKAESHGAALRQDAHEAHPEVQIELVFQRLFQEKGVAVELPRAIQVGRRFRELSTEYIHLYNGAKELLLSLKEQGCKLWLLSNAQAIFTRWELDRLGLADCFDGVYLSSDYGVKKPDRRFFEILLRERNIPPEQAVMIGNDGVCDIEGARALGLSTVYVRSNLSPNEPLPKANYVLEQIDLKQLLNMLSEEEMR